MNDIVTNALDRAMVAQAVQHFLDIANTHPDTPAGYSFTAEASGSKYRIWMNYGSSRSAHAFIDGNTGDVYKAATWKAPAKGIRYNLLTDMDKVAARFTWAGGWLYLDQIKSDNAREASK